MTYQGRRRIAAWLRRQAKILEKDYDKLADRYTARYMY
jgi:hypothetical protein